VGTAHEAGAPARPYPPSWIDRLTDGVRRLPLPSWVAYLALGLVLVLGYLGLLFSSLQWAMGALSLPTILLYSFLNGVTPVYLIGLLHYLDDSAAEALARFRPVLTLDEAEYERVRYQLTTLPPRATFLATVLGVIYTFIPMLISAAASVGLVTESPILVTLVVAFNALIYALVVVLIYHTLHQLRLVNTLYTEHTRINLFQPGPMYALSGLTARTAVGIGLPTYVWFQANSLSQQGVAVSDIIYAVFLSGLVVVTFIWPLLGAHRLLEREKQRLQDDVGRRIEATIATLHARADSGDLGDYGALKGVLDGLLTEQGVIDKLRTWPWRTETVGGLGIAFVVPIIIWIVQRVLERLGV
jgi:hypothetical protein